MYGKITTVTPGPMGETEIDREVTMQCFPVLVLRLLGDLFFFGASILFFSRPAAYDIGSNTIGIATLNCSGAQAPVRTRSMQPCSRR